jgi:hypothetical protein
MRNCFGKNPPAGVSRNDDLLVREWRTFQLQRLGLSRLLAGRFAGTVDWHDVAELVERGCPPELALRIVR